MNALRTPAAYGLLAVQLLFVLFVLEIPYYVADRFFARRRGDAFYRAQRSVARWFFRLYPFGRMRRVNVRASAFPQPCVIVCNHQSMLDILVALTLPVNARWFIKPWILRIPLVGELNKLARHINVGDEPGDPERPKGFDTAREWLADGVNILIFPEGTRSPDGTMRRFRNGAFLLAIEAGVPVVPVVLDGTGACVRKGSIAVNHPDVVLKVLAPEPTSGLQGEVDAARLKARVHERMQAELASIRAGERGGVPFVVGWLTRIAMFGAAMLIAAVTGLSLYVNNVCIADPPTYAGSRDLADEEARETTLDERLHRRIGDNWIRRRDGVNELAVAGTPWQRGYANARLTQELLHAQERHLLNTAREFLPDPVSFWLAQQLIAVNNRNLPHHVSEREQQEVLGLVEGSEDQFPDSGVPLYHRVLNYHAAHDISHVLIDNPLVTQQELAGCSAFAAWGPYTENEELWVARNFDWEAGEVFDKDKCVLYVWPDQGHAYVHVAWAGMAGAVTGMNAAGLSVHLNAARTDETRFGRVGTPVSILVKRVLEQASTVDHAYEILREASVFVSDSYLVASRDERRAVVIEKSPLHCTVRESTSPGVILQTNHFLGDEWRDDGVHREQMQRATTLYRWQRLEELTEAVRGRINARECMRILRDKRGRGDKDVGYGNRNTIDAGICTHSVIMNLTRGEMWVCAGPNTQGEYVHVPALAMLQAGPGGAMRMRQDRALNLSRDARFSLASDLAEFRKRLPLAREAADDADAQALAPHTRSLANLNPQAFETAYYRGRLAYIEGRFAEAVKHFEDTLARDPHYEAVREDVRLWLSRAERRSTD